MKGRIQRWALPAALLYGVITTWMLTQRRSQALPLIPVPAARDVRSEAPPSGSLPDTADGSGPDETGTRRSQHEALLSAASSDPLAAWRDVTSGNWPSSGGRHHQLAAGMLVASKGAAGFREIMDYHGEWQGESMHAALVSLAMNHPSEFVHVMESTKVPLTGQQARLLGLELAGSIPEAAIKWSSAIVSPYVREQAIAGAFEGWMGKDPEGATAWLDANKEAAGLDYALERVVSETMTSDPEASCAWAMQLKDPMLRSNLMESSFISWHERDPVAAQQWIQGANMDDGLRHHLMGISASKNPPFGVGHLKLKTRFGNVVISTR